MSSTRISGDIMKHKKNMSWYFDEYKEEVWNWQEDLRSAREFIRKNYGNSLDVKYSKRYNIFELAEFFKKRLYCGDFDVFYEDSCITYLEASEKFLKRNNLSIWEAQDVLYDYYTDVFFVDNHFEDILEIDPVFRRLCMLMICRYRDGTYETYHRLTVKYPEVDELFMDIFEERSDNYESMILIVDSNEFLQDIKCLKQSILGAVVKKDIIELYKNDDGLILFGRWIDALMDERRRSGR